MEGQGIELDPRELVAAYRQLQAEFECERQLRTEAEEERSRLKVRLVIVCTCRKMSTAPLNSTCDHPYHSIRSPLQRARDELAKQVLLLETRVADVEEDLDRSHEQLTALKAATAKAAAAPSAATAAAVDEEEDEEAAPSSRTDVKGLQKDIKMLLRELDRERTANLELVAVVEATQEDAAAAAERLVAAEKQVRALKKYGGAFAAPPSAADIAATPEQLHMRIASLKAARDRLIEALDVQAAEADRLTVENAALAETVLEVRSAAEAWEAQAQAGIAQCGQLKDLLEESASWGGGGDRPVEDPDAAAARCRGLEQELLRQQARRAEAEIHVTALCAELTRLAAASTGAHRAVLPVLCGVEARLAAVLSAKPGPRGGAPANRDGI